MCTRASSLLAKLTSQCEHFAARRPYTLCLLLAAFSSRTCTVALVIAPSYSCALAFALAFAFLLAPLSRLLRSLALVSALVLSLSPLRSHPHDLNLTPSRFSSRSHSCLHARSCTSAVALRYPLQICRLRLRSMYFIHCTAASLVSIHDFFDILCVHGSGIFRIISYIIRNIFILHGPLQGSAYSTWLCISWPFVPCSTWALGYA